MRSTRLQPTRSEEAGDLGERVALAAEQRDIAQRFAQSIANKFEGVSHASGALGVPLIEGAAAHLECRNQTRYYSGDHVIFIGHVIHYAYRDCPPLVFCGGRYASLA